MNFSSHSVYFIILKNHEVRRMYDTLPCHKDITINTLPGHECACILAHSVMLLMAMHQVWAIRQMEYVWMYPVSGCRHSTLQCQYVIMVLMRGLIREEGGCSYLPWTMMDVCFFVCCGGIVNKYSIRKWCSMRCTTFSEWNSTRNQIISCSNTVFAL